MSVSTEMRLADLFNSLEIEAARREKRRMEKEIEEQAGEEP